MPALFILGYAIARLWQGWGVKPVALIGHSAGEYVAACIAGTMTLADALAVVSLRGHLFESAPAGAMLSVDLSEADLQGAMAGLPLDIAAVNAPDLCLASGAAGAIDELAQRLSRRGIESRRVRIDVAAHSRLLDGVLGRFRERVATLRLCAPQVRFMSTLTGAWADHATLTDPAYWVRHLRETVRFADGLVRLVADLPGCVLVEAGPGQGLCALARQNGVQGGAALASTGGAHDRGGDLGVMTASAGALWTRGHSPDWRAMRSDAAVRRIPLPTYAFEPQRHWIEPGVPAAQTLSPVAAAVPDSPAPFQRLAPYDAWFRVPRWVAAPLAGRQPPTASRWLVFGSGPGLNAAIAARASAQGAQKHETIMSKVEKVRGPASRAADSGSTLYLRA